MKARKMNANQLAKAGGLRTSTVYTFLRPDKRGCNVHHQTLTKIARGLDVPIGLLHEPDDGDVAQLLTAWSTLDDDRRRAVLDLIDALNASQG
jgi:hypothetical protein